MAQEGIVRDAHHRRADRRRPTRTSSRRSGREELKKEILKDIKKNTDVKVEQVLFSDLTVQ